eukprot:jgi/Undpi1/1215/HiC_scaffold_107.g14129.m1
MVTAPPANATPAPAADGGQQSAQAAVMVVDDDGSSAGGDNETAQTVTAAINAFTPPSTRTLLPKPARASSEAWKYGLKLKVNATGKSLPLLRPAWSSFFWSCSGDRSRAREDPRPST